MINCSPRSLSREESAHWGDNLLYWLIFWENPFKCSLFWHLLSSLYLTVCALFCFVLLLCSLYPWFFNYFVFCHCQVSPDLASIIWSYNRRRDAKSCVFLQLSAPSWWVTLNFIYALGKWFVNIFITLNFLNCLVSSHKSQRIKEFFPLIFFHWIRIEETMLYF